MRPALSIATLAVLGAVACGACGPADETVPVAQVPAAAPTDAPPVAAPPKAAPSASSPAPPLVPPAQPPSGLACLAKHFVGTPIAQGKGWALHLPDGTDLPWDDGATKAFAVAMEKPDLQDTLSIPYTRGAIVADNTVDLDPGRIRNDLLFKATYGATSAAVQQGLVEVELAGQNVKFHTRAAAALGKVSAKLKLLVAQTPSLGAYVTGELGGTFDWRPIANTTRMSAHSYGVAIDIVVAKSNYWEWEKTPTGQFVWKNQIPQAIVDAFEAEGFAWGGRWYHYDTMHFEWRPELFDAACKP